jgi:hypothetical protein
MRLHLGRGGMKSSLQSLLLALVAGMSGALTVSPLIAMESLAQRIAHTDLDKSAASSSHDATAAGLSFLDAASTRCDRGAD